MTRVLVVGAGPGGMVAASVAAERGCAVTLLDENPSAGGQLWRGADAGAPEKSAHGYEFANWLGRLKASGAEFCPGSTVVDHPSPGLLRVERDGHGLDLPFDRLIIATGARERFVPLPGWTLPGVVGVGGLQALVKSGLPVAGKRIVVAGSGPLLLAVAAALSRQGANVCGIFEQASWLALVRLGVVLAGHPGKLFEGAHYRWQTIGAPYQPGWWVRRAKGTAGIQSVEVTNGVATREIACDYLACGFHLVPNLELPQLMGCRIESGHVAVNQEQQSSLPSVFCIGETTGIGGLDKALVEGQIAGLVVAGQLGKAAQLRPLQLKLRRFSQELDRAFALRAELRSLAQAGTIVCRCEDVTRAALEQCATGRAARLHTRCGMGPCQGRVCGPATEFLFGWSVAGVRPPLFPARISTLAASPQTAAPPGPDPAIGTVMP